MAYIYDTCNNCPHLVKEWISEDHLGYDAACSKVIEVMNGKNLIRVIRKHVGDMIGIETPKWCPMKCNGNFKAEEDKEVIIADEKPIVEEKSKTLKEMNYQERKEYLGTMKPHLSWDNFVIGKKYIIPKWDMYSNAKEIVIVSKFNGTMSYHELDEFGNEKAGLISLKDTEEKLPIIVESHKF